MEDYKLRDLRASHTLGWSWNEVYYESRKRELKKIIICKCRCNERLKAKAEGSTRLAYTGLCGGLEHLKIETRLRGERFESVKGERTKTEYSPH